MSGNPYPPCFNGGCNDEACCAAQGVRVSWPETVGKDSNSAVSLILQTNPTVGVVVVPKGQAILPDFCCNRVYLFVDTNNKVAATPHVG